jgi:rhodanese-related sulfurtransferase/membrane protein insertase Oxa1/YidC/SpoIIIJ/phosphohistidine swiveling domain-containing protein/molybdenum-dependent DNA-binding transcriptional regulator ModE
MSAAVAGALVFCLGSTGSALAIPSPELVVGSFTSISQIFALASAFLGGGAALATFRMRSRGAPGFSPRLVAIAIAGVVLLIASVAFNLYQFVGARAERLARLQDTLLRQATTPGGPKLDPKNLELSYTDMVKQPTGITTEEAAKLLDAVARGERDDLMFIDVRETAERDMGEVPGAAFIRFPDFAAAKLDFANKKPIFFCHNGNRSWETCAALRAMGIDCRFVIGGIEKWIVEGRPLNGLNHRTLDDLRAIPDYPNHEVLLDTPDVRRLVKDQGAVFVDIRYPAEFASGHLPDAINLTLRTTPTPELPGKLAALPRRPIVLPCYDRRGCFFAEVMGLELTRAGYDFRGRYTLPWEYYVPRGRPPHVDKWLAETNQSWWSKASRFIASVLTSISAWTGIIPAILLLAIISRLLVLPFSVKAERDQIKSRAVADDLRALKLRLKHDPPRLMRATGGFYKRHGITPVRNLIALLFLPIMALALSAVQLAVSTDNHHLGWIADLAGRDRWLVLPGIFAALITLYIDMAFARTRLHRLAVWAVAFPLFVATGALFSAGTDIYLVASAALLVIQRMVVGGTLGRALQAWRRRRLGSDVVSLDDPVRLSGHGNKAFRLARMRAAGMPVPDGLLLTPAFLAALTASPADRRRARLDRLWGELGGRRLAVRSSASHEDDVDHSFAGVFESVLDVERDALEAAISKVHASFQATRAQAYMPKGGAGSVLIQRMIAADYAGVLFTRDPSAGGVAMVEMVKGTAENLVSGTVRPWTFRFGRVTGRQFGDGVAPIDLAPLLALGRQAEDLFGRPQDIEWTYAGGRFQLVQSRDITRRMAREGDEAVLQDDLGRALDVARGAAPDEVVFAKNELSEMLPRPTTLSLSLMEALWAAGGSVDQAARKLGFSYRVAEESTYLVTILGRLYVDKRQERSRALAIGSLAARRLLRNAERIERGFREDFLPHFLGEIRIAEAADFDRLSAAELVEEIARLRERFVHDTHVEVDTVNIAANFYLDRARRALIASGLDPSSVLGHIPETLEGKAIAEAAAVPAESRHWFLVRSVGHRAAFDYELAEPRHSESPDSLAGFADARQQAPHAVGAQVTTLGKRLSRLVDIARRFQTLKEDAKHQSLRELALLRRAALALDRQLCLGGLVFHIAFGEIAGLLDERADNIRATASCRCDDAARLRKTDSLPSAVSADDLEAVSAGSTRAAHRHGGALGGTRVSGSRMVTARARVICGADAERGNVIGSFQDGDIIVAPMINPNWLPYFGRAGGFVSELGGWLSHTAILAREHDVPMIVGVEGFSAIPDGSLVRLHLDGGVELVEEAQALDKTVAA